MNTPLISIENLTHEGRGIAHLEGKTLFLENGLPGEKVTFQILKKRSSYDEGIVTQILEKSRDRVEPECPHFHQCGGCQLQHLNSSAQLAFKQSVLEEQLMRFGGIKPQNWAPPLSGPIWHYRRRARLSVKYVLKKGKVLVGFHEKNGRFIADLSSCKILPQALGEHLEDLKNLIASLSIYREIPQIEVAAAEEGIALIIRHLKPFTETDIKTLLTFSEHYGLIIYLQAQGPDSLIPLVENSPTLHYSLPEYNLKLRFHPTAFIQINEMVNQKMIHQALDWLALQSSDRVLELFCGLGNFTLPLATHCEEVMGLEGEKALIDLAKENATFNKIHNAHFAQVNLTQNFLAELKNKDFNKLLLDPPRTGAKEVIESLTNTPFEKILYVSCNAATLARDAGILKTQGYQLKVCGILDMFPHTAHWETMALFEKT